MKKLPIADTSEFEDRFGQALSRHLSEGTSAVHADIRERLRVARQQAMSRRALGPVREGVTLNHAGATATASANAGTRWWHWCLSAVPLIALVTGLVLIVQWQADDRAQALAEIDAALLTDELPTAAYTDPGFKQFLLRDTHIQ